MSPTRKITVGILCLCFFLTPLAVWTGHFLPFETMKSFLFAVLSLAAAFCAAVGAVLEARWGMLKDRLTLAVSVYMVWNCLLFVIMPYTDPHFLFMLLCCGALFLAVRLSCDDRGRDLIISALFAAGLLSALYAILQFAGIDYQPFVDYFGGRKTLGIRSFSFFGNPNLLGSFCAALIPLVTVFAVMAWRKKQSWRAAGLSALLLLTVAALVLSQTRSAWLAAGAAMALLALFMALRAAKRFDLARAAPRSLALGATITFLLGLAVIVYAYLPWGGERQMPAQGLFHSQTIDLRLFFYRNTMKMIGESPATFFLGRGPGTFNVHYPAFRDGRQAFRLGEVNPEYRVEHPHSEHLEIVSDTGLIGYLLFLWVIGEALWRLLEGYDWVSLAVGASIMALLIDGLMTQSLRFIVIGSLLWLMIGFSGIAPEEAKAEMRGKMNPIPAGG